MENTRPIYVVKRRSNHAGHHGGAWKVAYADFVTAMMALFIVLWLLNTSKKVQEAVSGYFKDPTGKTSAAAKPAPARGGAGESISLTKDNISNLKRELESAVGRMPALEKLRNQIQMTVTNEGLRVDLIESEKGTFFPSGSPQPTAAGREILVLLAREIGKLPNRVSIEGHTDAQPFAAGANYGNWELSADRANAARRVLQESGLRPHQTSQIRGYADERLMLPDKPHDPSNRRVSLLVNYFDNDRSTPHRGEASP